MIPSARDAEAPPFPSRRSVVKGAAWTVPTVVAAVSAPAFAMSQVSTDVGLFVSASRSQGGIGYQNGNNTGAGSSTSDLNWNSGAGRPANCNYYTNGEGTFTPHSTSRTGVDGSYSSSSGFWFATPRQGGEHVKGSTATLEAGARFTTRVTFTVPAGTNAQWVVDRIFVNVPGNPSSVNPRTNPNYWHPENSTTRAQGLKQGVNGTGHLAFEQVEGTFAFSRSAHTVNEDGGITFTGELTFTTSRTVTVTDNGTTHFGQVIIMPGRLGFFDSYGWSRFELTSWVSNARITYTLPDRTSVEPTTLGPSSLQQATFIRPC